MMDVPLSLLSLSFCCLLLLCHLISNITLAICLGCVPSQSSAHSQLPGLWVRGCWREDCDVVGAVKTLMCFQHLSRHRQRIQHYVPAMGKINSSHLDRIHSLRENFTFFTIIFICNIVSYLNRLEGSLSTCSGMKTFLPVQHSDLIASHTYSYWCLNSFQIRRDVASFLKKVS